MLSDRAGCADHNLIIVWPGASVTSHESEQRSTLASRSTATVLSPANLTAGPGGGGGTTPSYLEVPDHESHLSASPLSADHVFFQQHHQHPAAGKNTN